MYTYHSTLLTYVYLPHHIIIAGEEILGESAEVDASGNKKLPLIGEFMKSKIVTYFKSKVRVGVVGGVGVGVVLLSFLLMHHNTSIVDIITYHHHLYHDSIYRVWKQRSNTWILPT